jgi:hypothetical protein
MSSNESTGAGNFGGEVARAFHDATNTGATDTTADTGTTSTESSGNTYLRYGPA